MARRAGTRLRGSPLIGAPEPLEGLAVRGLAELLERALPYLADALTRDTHQRPDLFERHRLAALLEAVIEVQNLTLARCEILLEDAIDEIAHQPAVGAVFDDVAFLAGEALPKGGCVLVGAIDRCIEGQLGGGHAAGRADVLDGVFQGGGDLVVGRLATQLLGEIRLGAAHADELGVLIQRDAHAARLLRQRFEHGLAHPPHRVGDELHPLVGIELLDGLEKAFVADAHQLGQVQPPALVLLDVRDHETEVRRDEAFRRLLVSLSRPPRDLALLLRVVDEGIAFDVLEILIEGIEGSRIEEHDTPCLKHDGAPTRGAATPSGIPKLPLYDGGNPRFHP
jgi:hypothetical protein